MKKIGFVDYYISEWHANNYPAWIKEACEKLGTEYKVAYAWAELDVSPFDGRRTNEWCECYGVEKCETLEELCEKSDVIMILAPSNPETHLDYARRVLKYGKRTYIDKTFAPDLEVAKEIFRIGKECGARFFSSSALRYSEALEGVSGARRVTTFGGGSNFDEYSVHQAEMVIASLKSEPLAVKAEAQGRQYIISVKLSEDKEATMIYSPDLTFAMSWENAAGERSYKAPGKTHFPNLIADIINFFECGEVSFDTAETLIVMKLREATLRATSRLGEWIEL
jgi:hypothetical protein